MGRGQTKKYYQAMNEYYVEGTLTCLKPDVIKRKISTEFPLVLNIEPTNDCNANCYYCTHLKTVKAQGRNFLDIVVFKKIIDQISPNKLIMLNLHKDGEPLLHKDLPEMVAYAKENDVAHVIHLNTNGVLINTKTGRGIIEAGIDDITISVDASSEKTYQKFKRIKGLAKLEKNIIEALNFRDKIDSRTKIRVKIMEFDGIDTEEIETFKEKWDNIADEIQVTGVHDWSGAIKNFRITDEQSFERYPCALFWYMLAINSNGKVSVCNVDWDYSGVVGDIHNQTIKEIWNGENIKRIRRAHLGGIWNCPEVCGKCVVWVSVGNVWKYLKTREEFV